MAWTINQNVIDLMSIESTKFFHVNSPVSLTEKSYCAILLWYMTCQLKLTGFVWVVESWKVMEFKNLIFQAWKVIELNCQSLKVMENLSFV